MAGISYRDLRSPEELLNADLKKLMSTDWGRRIAHSLIYDFGNILSVGYDLSVRDGMCAALHHARTDGVRSVGRAFMERLHLADENAYIAMLEEEAQARKAAISLGALKRDNNPGE